MFRKMMSRRGKIVNLLVVSMLVVGTIPLMISGYNLISYNANILWTDQQILHSQISKSVSSELSLFLKSCFNLLVPLAKNLELGFDKSQPESIFYRNETFELLNSIFKDHDRIINIRTVFSGGRGREAGYRIEEDTELAGLLRETFIKCTAGKYTYVSKPYYSGAFGQLVVVIGKTIIIDNQVRGAITVVFSMADIHDTIQRLSSSGNTAYLLDNKGYVILHPDIGFIQRKVNYAGTAVFKELQSLSSRAISTIPFQDASSGKAQSMVATVSMIPEADVDWGIVVQTEESVVTAVIQEMQRKTVLWIMLSIVLAIVMSYLFSRRISIPISKLAERTVSITEGNFSERVDIDSHNELGLLADNFNLMSERIENYIQRLKQAAQENRQLFLGATRTLAAAIDAKDPYTLGHSERVTLYSELIARELDLSEEDIEKVQIAALLHDVGKIGISDRILQKPTQLTDEEFSIMKQHPELGGNIMSQIPQLKDIIPGMRYHHESLDGSGYPRGLRGDEIPLAARIIGVADAFDAMTTERPYQKPFTPDEALERIRTMAVRKFDLSVVEALGRAYQKGKIQMTDSNGIHKSRYLVTS